VTGGPAEARGLMQTVPPLPWRRDHRPPSAAEQIAAAHAYIVGRYAAATEAPDPDDAGPRP
jgi:hypothetical protein